MRHTKQQPVAWWMAKDSHALHTIVDDILREEAWWIAVRSGQYAQQDTIWADRMNEVPMAQADWRRPSPWHGPARDAADKV